MKNERIDQLRKLYAQSSKHSSYQRLAPTVAALLSEDLVTSSTRHEAERWDFISSSVDFAGKSVCDVGANTGYFTFRALEAGAESVDVFEGNAAHCSFVQLSAEALGLSGRIVARNAYLDFERTAETGSFDIFFLLNVLHHYGDDYGHKESDQSVAKNHIANALNQLSGVSRLAVFQLGFNQKGDRSKPLFTHGTKREMIDFIREACVGSWEIVRIGVACLEDGAIRFRDLDEINVQRIDSFGEFLNRPLFIMRSLQCA